jgi:hypothetical protein
MRTTSRQNDAGLRFGTAIFQTVACREKTVPVGPPAEIKRADSPRRAIEIVAPAGQLYATTEDVLIVTARATQKVHLRVSGR